VFDPNNALVPKPKKLKAFLAIKSIQLVPPDLTPTNMFLSPTLKKELADLLVPG
jgi:hypothetical protein